MTPAELDALLTLLRRTPLTPAEVLWVNDWLDRQRAALPPSPAPTLPPSVPPTQIEGDRT